MKKKHLILALSLLAITSCSSTTDITKNPSKMTDFVSGQTYALKKPAWMLHSTLMTFRGKEPADSEGILTSGTKLGVCKIIIVRSFEMGTSTEVSAKVLTGEYKGKTVNLSRISEIMKTGYTKLDPMMLDSVKDEF